MRNFTTETLLRPMENTVHELPRAEDAVYVAHDVAAFKCFAALRVICYDNTIRIHDFIIANHVAFICHMTLLPFPLISVLIIF